MLLVMLSFCQGPEVRASALVGPRGSGYHARQARRAFPSTSVKGQVAAPGETSHASRLFPAVVPGKVKCSLAQTESSLHLLKREKLIGFRAR